MSCRAFDALVDGLAPTLSCLQTDIWHVILSPFLLLIAS